LKTGELLSQSVYHNYIKLYNKTCNILGGDNVFNVRSQKVSIEFRHL